MPAVGWPGGFATIGRGRYATRPGSRRWVIANHLLVEKVQTRAQMLHQWDQRSCTDARQIGRVRAGSDRRLGEIGRRDPNRPRPSVRQRDNDVGGTAPRPLLQHLKPVPKQKMMRVVDRDVRHDPVKNSGTLSCSATPPLAMRYWTASFTMPTASSSKATVYAVTPTKRKSRDHPRPIAPTAHRSLPRASLRRSWGTPRRARGPPMDRRDDLRTNPQALTRRPFQAHINPSVVFVSSDHHHLESVITIGWNT